MWQQKGTGPRYHEEKTRAPGLSLRSGKAPVRGQKRVHPRKTRSIAILLRFGFRIGITLFLFRVTVISGFISLGLAIGLLVVAFPWIVGICGSLLLAPQPVLFFLLLLQQFSFRFHRLVQYRVLQEWNKLCHFLGLHSPDASVHVSGNINW